jgi:hypothetical protein
VLAVVVAVQQVLEVLVQITKAAMEAQELHHLSQALLLLMLVVEEAVQVQLVVLGLAVLAAAVRVAPKTFLLEMELQT